MMNTTTNALIPNLLLMLYCCGVYVEAVANEPPKKVEREMIIKKSIPHFENQELTAVTVKLAPRVQVPAHQHEGLVYVFVLEGEVESQLDGGEIITYQQGQNWVELPGVIHSLTRNPSAEQSAKLLAVFIAGHGAELTTSGKIPE